MSHADAIIAEFRYLYKTYKDHTELSGDPSVLCDLLMASGRHAAAGKINSAEFERIVDSFDNIALLLEKDRSQDLRAGDFGCI